MRIVNEILLKILENLKNNLKNNLKKFLNLEKTLKIRENYIHC